MKKKDISYVYSEDELIDILNFPYETDKSIEELEVQLTALCQLCKLTEEQRQLCSVEYLIKIVENSFSLEVDTVFTSTMKWIKKLTENIYPKLPEFVDSVDKVFDHVGNSIKNIANKRNDKKLSEEYIRERFKQIDTYRETAKSRQTCFVKDAVEYQKQLNRIEGLTAICKTIVNMAESQNVEDFSSDKIYDALANQSNGVVKAEEPREGSQFRRFVWVKPYTREYDFKKSEWMQITATNTVLKTLLKVKYDAFDELEKAAKYIQKLCGNLKSEVQHIRKDNLEEVSITYARTFMVAKCINDVQNIVLKEINWFVTSGITGLGKFDEERSPRSYEFGKFKNK